MEYYLNELINRYPILESCREAVFEAFQILSRSFEIGNKLLVAGNGGSASDADHVVGELMKSFRLKRKIDENLCKKLKGIDEKKGKELSEKLQKALPVISLCNHNSLNTAILNDVDGKLCFAQQVQGYGAAGDVLLAISTSGNSENILYAAVTAKAKEMAVIALTGNGGGELASVADLTITVNEAEVYRIQELHMPIYHCLCRMLEKHFFG